MEYKELKQYFELNCKPSAASRDGQKLGAEYETMVIVPEKNDVSLGKYMPLGMEGGGGIPEILLHFQEQGKTEGIEWVGKYEGQELIGLQNQHGASITIEPGGQIELSDQPQDSLKEVESSIKSFVRNLKESICHVNGRLLFLGAHPLLNLEKIPLSPKKRYRIMYPHMEKMGSHGQWMMKATAGTQLSIDYASLEDLERKFRVICRLSPFLTAIFSNSPLHLGKPTGYKSFRNYIWQNTDPTRCGIPASFIGQQFRIEDYIEWALNASPYHLKSSETAKPLMDYSFNQLMHGAHSQINIDFEDWKDHLGMLFPEIRIKNIIEIRSMDTLNPEDVLAVPSLLQTLIYDESVFASLESLLMDLPEEEFPWYQQVAARDGLEGQVNSVNFRKFAITLIEKALESTTPEEGCRLVAFFNRYTRHGLSPADFVIERFYGVGEDPFKWIQKELETSEEKESSFINYPCDFEENSHSFLNN